jgi:hypothetical protein
VGLSIPGELSSLLSMLGYNWPQGDESKLKDMGSAWQDFGNKLPQLVQQADQYASKVWGQNEGSGIDAFKQLWSGSEAPTKNLESGGKASGMIGVGMMVISGVVLALKIQTIVQLTTLAIEIAQAIASAVVTFGASLAEIPIFKQITSMLIQKLIDMALNAVLGGGN